MTEFDPERPDDIDDAGGYNRDPGATPDDAGVPEVADDMTPGTGDVPEPEVASMPTEAPVEASGHGTTAREQAENASLEDRLAAEEPEVDAPGGPADTIGPMHVEEEPPDG